MSPRYEVIKRLCLPSGAALPSLLSPPWLWGSPALNSPVARPHGEAQRPPTAHRNHSHRTIWEVGPCPSHPAMPLSWKQILSPQAGHLAAVQLIT